MPRVCPRCGTSCGDTQAFCPRCGTKLQAGQPSPGQQPYGQRPTQGQQPYGQRPPQGQPYYAPQGPGSAASSISLISGLKQLSTSLVLQLVAYGIMLISVIILISSGAGILTSGSYRDLENAVGGAVGGVIFFFIALIVLLIGTIFNIIGASSVSKENQKFKIGFYMLLAFLALFIISIIVIFNEARSWVPNTTLITLLWVLTIAANAAMLVFTCGGIKEVGMKLGANDIIQGQNVPMIANLIAEGLLILSLLITSSASGILTLLAWICSTVGLFLYIGYIRKAIRAVSGTPAANPYQQPRY